MNEFLKVALTACIPAMTVIFGWGLNKGVSIANGYINNKFAQTCLQNAATAVFNAVQYVNQTYVDALKEQDKFDEAAAAHCLQPRTGCSEESPDAGDHHVHQGDLRRPRQLPEADDRSSGAQSKDLYVMFSRHHEKC